MQRANPPLYRNNPIVTIDKLAKHLGVPEDEIRFVAREASRFIFPNKPEPKPSGGHRQTYRIGKRLRAIQDRIKIKIFRHIAWPMYLHGAIRDVKAPRDHITDAVAHANGAHTINLDVSKFFPSISSENVYLMWLSGFKFSSEVADILTRITTREGWLYEGAPTSPLIANMIFGGHESDLVNELSAREIVYTRFVDDITVSAARTIPSKELSEILRDIYGMLINKGLKPNRKKQKMYIGVGNGKVHAIVTRRGRVHYDKPRRKAIKLEAYNLIKASSELGRSSEVYRERYNSVVGKLSMMRRLHPEEAQREMDRILDFPPIF